MAEQDSREQSETADILKGLARAAAGSLLFALPVLMTMEMWALGADMGRDRLIALLLLNLPLLVFLSHYSGFEPTFDWKEDLRDVAVAFGIAMVTSALVLALFNVIHFGMSSSEIIGCIAIQVVPGSFGALLARSQFGGDAKRPQGRENETYGSELMLMACGALFLSLNVAPTEEMLLISYKMDALHILGLALLSLALMHGFVFASGFKGGSELSPEGPPLSEFLRFTVVGYVIALLICAFVLWSFGSTDGHALPQVIHAAVVLGFPAAVGAAAARLIL